MHRVILPGTRLDTSRFGFGTASLHHILHARKRRVLLGAAVDAGITHFDTARMYGDGIAERSLGSFLRGGLRQRVTLASKVGIPANRLSEAFPPALYLKRATGSIGRRLGWPRARTDRRCFSETEAEASLRLTMSALGTDWLDILFVHEPAASHLEELARLAPWLKRQTTSGRVRYLGLSGSASECLQIHMALPGLFDILQVEDSLFGCEADELEAAGVPIQVTYGYFRRAAAASPGRSEGAEAGKSVIAGAVARNPAGLILVATRKVERIRNLVDPAEEGTINPHDTKSRERRCSQLAVRRGRMCRGGGHRRDIPGDSPA